MSTSVQLVNFPSDFWVDVQMLNDAKTIDAPCALILSATHDHNGSLTNRPSLFFMLSIAKTHRLFVRIINNKSRIKPAILQAKILNHNRSIQLLVFNTHGDIGSLQLGITESYRLEDVVSQDFENVDPSAEIFIKACHGKELAERIANISNRVTFATPQGFNPIDSSVNFCNAHRMLEMRAFDQGKQHVIRFQRGRAPSCCIMPVGNKEYFSERRCYIERLLPRIVNPKEQFEIGEFFEIDGNLPLSIVCFSTAAAKGFSLAQWRMGLYYEGAGNLILAKVYYRKAAEQGDSLAQLSLGSFLEIEGNIAEAKIWYELSAAQGNSLAQRFLDRLRS